MRGSPTLEAKISLFLSRSMSCSGTLTAEERLSSAKVRGVKSRHVTPTPLKSSEDDATLRHGCLRQDKYPVRLLRLHAQGFGLFCGARALGPGACGGEQVSRLHGSLASAPSEELCTGGHSWVYIKSDD